MQRKKAYAWTVFLATLLLLLLLFGFLSAWVAFGSAANVMSQVGLQRARSERLTKDALILSMSTTALEHAQALSEMQDTLPVWVEAEHALQFGDSALGLPQHPPASVVLLVAQAQSDYTPMLVAAQHILANVNHIDPAQVQILLDHEHAYATTMSQVNTAWQQHIDDVFFQLFWIESGFVAAIATIVALNFFVIMRL